MAKKEKEHRDQFGGPPSTVKVTSPNFPYVPVEVRWEAPMDWDGEADAAVRRILRHIELFEGRQVEARDAIQTEPTPGPSDEGADVDVEGDTRTHGEAPDAGAEAGEEAGQTQPALWTCPDETFLVMDDRTVWLITAGERFSLGIRESTYAGCILWLFTVTPEMTPSEFKSGIQRAKLKRPPSAPSKIVRDANTALHREIAPRLPSIPLNVIVFAKGKYSSRIPVKVPDEVDGWFEYVD